MKKLNDYKNECDNTREVYRAALDFFYVARDNLARDDINASRYQNELDREVWDAARDAYDTGVAHEDALAAYESELNKKDK